jgi:putative ABC transport system substrate-binding protein
MAINIGRREVIALGGVAAAWPLVADAQPSSKLRRIGVLMTFAADDPDGQADFAALAQGLQEAGWTVGRNLRFDARWGANDVERFRAYAAELIGLAPDVVVAMAGSVVTAFQQASRTVPIVFVTTIDPVGGGWVESLARPGGNATGFSSYEFSIGTKWLEMLKETAPELKRIGVVRDASVPAGSGGFAAIQAATASSSIELIPIGVRDADEIERAIGRFATGANGGLIFVGPPSSLVIHRDLIHQPGGSTPAPHGLSEPPVHHPWRPDVLRSRFNRPVPSRSVVHRSHSQG